MRTSTPTTIIDAFGDPITAPNGSVTHDGTTITYVPKADFWDYNGPDTVSYTIQDSDGDISTATLTINVNAVNDPPF